MLEFIAGKGCWSSGLMVFNPSWGTDQFWGCRHWGPLLGGPSLQVSRDDKGFMKPHRMAFPTMLRRKPDLKLVCSPADNNYKNIPAQCWAKAKTQEGNLFFPVFFLLVNNTQKALILFLQAKNTTTWLTVRIDTCFLPGGTSYQPNSHAATHQGREGRVRSWGRMRGQDGQPRGSLFLLLSSVPFFMLF